MKVTRNSRGTLLGLCFLAPALLDLPVSAIAQEKPKKPTAAECAAGTADSSLCQDESLQEVGVTRSRIARPD